MYFWRRPSRTSVLFPLLCGFIIGYIVCFFTFTLYAMASKLGLDFIPEEHGTILSQEGKKEEMQSYTANRDYQVLCPEAYHGAAHFKSHGVGFYRKPCVWSVPIHNILTVILLFESFKYKKAVVTEIGRMYPQINMVQIVKTGKVIYVARANQSYANPEHVSVMSNGPSLSDVLNNVMADVRTDFIFIGRQLTQFNNNSKFERLIDMMAGTDLAAVAGAVRHTNGYWVNGCVQIEIKNYAIKLQDGYHKSIQECMYCDYVQSSFIIRKKIVRNIKFSNLPGDSMLIDYFLKLKEAKLPSVTCPDVMYYSSISRGSSTPSKSEWINLATDWMLNTVILQDGRLDFFCAEVSMECDSEVAAHFMLPPCCISLITSMLKCFVGILEKHDIEYYLTDGSILGAVKFSDYLPWDIDVDVKYRKTDQKKISKILPEFSAAGCPLIEHDCEQDAPCYGLLTHRGKYKWSGLAIDFWPLNEWQSYLSDSQRTKVKFHDIWVTTFDSPGLIVRNKYGYNYPKHSTNWMHNGFADEFGEYKPGKFNKCPSNSSSCLDKFDIDGNLGFTLT